MHKQRLAMAIIGIIGLFLTFTASPPPPTTLFLGILFIIPIIVAIAGERHECVADRMKFMAGVPPIIGGVLSLIILRGINLGAANTLQGVTFNSRISSFIFGMDRLEAISYVGVILASLTFIEWDYMKGR